MEVRRVRNAEKQKSEGDAGKAREKRCERLAKPRRNSHATNPS